MLTTANVWILHTDGACKGNPGPSGVGVALYKPGATEPTATVAERIPNTTNNVAEYSAFIRGLKEALLRGADRLEVRTDSELMAHQINGRYKVSAPQILPLYTEAKGLLARFASVKVVHVLREQNALADKLANQGVAGGTVGAPKSVERAIKTVPAGEPVRGKTIPIPELPYRKHSRLVDGERWVWNMERLWEAAKELPVEMVPVSRFDNDLNTDYWFGEDVTPTLRNVADHAKRIYDADLSRPIILDPDGGLMDGGHRLARAYLEGKTQIATVRLRTLPDPDLKLRG
ncbi:MAG: ribonuclease HI family protein [Fibrella sp.]|nr:ribonuclease HI family protein [Armatimonadota bacterium]